MRVARSGRDAEVAQQGLADQMRRTSRGVAQAEIDARLAEVRRQQLRMTIGEMQQMHVAEARHVVDVRARSAPLRRGPPAESPRRMRRRRTCKNSRRFTRSPATLRVLLAHGSRHLLTGDCGSISSAVTSLICCSVRILLVAEARHASNTAANASALNILP